MALKKKEVLFIELFKNVHRMNGKIFAVICEEKNKSKDIALGLWWKTFSSSSSRKEEGRIFNFKFQEDNFRFDLMRVEWQ